MYHVSNKLLCRAKNLPLPLVHPSHQLPDVFFEYFLNKVKLICDDLDLQTAVSPVHDDPYTVVLFVAFQPVSEEHVRNVIFKSAPKTCSLDSIPTSSFVECSEEILPTVTHTQSTHLLSLTFLFVVVVVVVVVLSKFKTVIVKPLLEKPSLDHNNLKKKAIAQSQNQSL